MKKLSALLLSLLLMLSLVACGGGTTPPPTEDDPAENGEVVDPAEGGELAADPGAPGEAAGFEEFPIGDDIELEWLNVAGVYFQPVDMEPAGESLAPADSDFHLEADISALANDLGYGTGDFVPYLTVDYEIWNEDESTLVQEGSFMPMNASDGPHYGNNIALAEAGTYVVKFIINAPTDYLLHVDAETGITGRFFTEPLVAEWTWDYIPREW